MEQISFLNKTPNASETVRKLLDSILEVWYDIEAKFPSLVLKHQIDLLEQQLSRLQKERTSYFYDHNEDMDQLITHKGPNPDIPGEFYDWVERIPRQTPEADYHRKVLKGMEDAVAAIKVKIKELQDKVRLG